MRLDHVIYEVPDIAAAHARLVRVFPEAWPVGPFWKPRLTSGAAIGGLNLELVELAGERPRGTTLVFEPEGVEWAERVLADAGVPYATSEKVEPDPELLRLRGFDEAAARTPQSICTNVVPAREDLPFDFFFCAYAPFLKGWLSPAHPRLETRERVSRIVVGTPDPASAGELLERLRYASEPRIEFEEHAEREILRVDLRGGGRVVVDPTG